MGGEKPYERRAADAVGRALGRRLRRYECEPDGDDSLDYIDDVNEVYEMKLVTPEEYQELRALRTQTYPSNALAMHWSILIEAPTMDDKFRPMPEFRDDDSATIAAVETDGFRVTRKAEHEAEWRERYSGRRLHVPRIGKREAELLEQHLLVLEQAGITQTRGAVPRTTDERNAIHQIHVLTRAGICMVRPAVNGDAGITIRVGWGYVRTGDPSGLRSGCRLGSTRPLAAISRIPSGGRDSRAVMVFSASTRRSPNSGARKRRCWTSCRHAL